MFESAFPILSSPDIRRSLGFYRDVLGGIVRYQFPPEGEPAYVSMDIGASHLGIGHDPTVTVGREQQRFSLWVYVEDCDAAVEQLRAHGSEVVEEPVDQPWGERVARALDPDGNILIIGSRPH